MIFYKSLSRFPLPLLYTLSWVFSFFLFHLLRYRRTTSFNNIRNSFPKLEKKEIIKIQRQAYRNICDSFFELVKSYDISSVELQSRVTVHNIESLKSAFNNNQSVLLLSAHTAPTEWVAQALHLQLDCFIDPVYKPAHSSTVDRFVFAARSRYSATPIPYKKLAKDIVRRANVRRGVAILADLAPRRREQSITLKFLNQPTRFFLSLERIARLANTPVFFIGIKRISKGRYEATAHKLCDQPSHLQDDELIKQYAQHVENMIKQNPADWLWTHRRWKHSVGLNKQPQNATG